jgi:NAD(P)-dependent dehydrogenase (short-subunit alcohol dehydrogenase family)
VTLSGSLDWLAPCDAAKGKAAAEKLCAEGIDAHFVKLEVSSPADVEALPGFFKESFGRLDVLVNNAGVAEWTNDDPVTFRRTFEPDLFGVVAVTYALLPLLEDNPAGRIANALRGGALVPDGDSGGDSGGDTRHVRSRKA